MGNPQKSKVNVYIVPLYLLYNHQRDLEVLASSIQLLYSNVKVVHFFIFLVYLYVICSLILLVVTILTKLNRRSSKSKHTIQVEINKEMSTTHYILHLKHNNGSNIPDNLLNDIKGVVSKFDGKVKDDFKLVPGFTFSLPTKIGESFKNAADSWGSRNGVTVEIEQDQQVHAL